MGSLVRFAGIFKTFIRIKPLKFKKKDITINFADSLYLNVIQRVMSVGLKETIETQKYCNSLTRYSRRKSREVYIGDVPLGGNNPIRVQSMTTVDTMDTEACVQQSIRMIDAGSEYVRITAPSLNEAKNLEIIKKELRNRGYSTPLIADIHFTPNAAEMAARIVEKVRVNPGNYADKKKFEQIRYTRDAYQAELDRIREKFAPLVRICKEYGTAMRIGTNHGSLSDRIMSRYGDTPLGMVESALEFVRICEDMGYYDIVLSMKASNPIIMIEAYRLLVNMLDKQHMKPYPLHLGVTEAGEAEDGRIKSAIGIGTLLEEGLGDTIRVSLTEEPEDEIPVARNLVDRYLGRTHHRSIPELESYPVNPFEYQKRNTRQVLNIGDGNVPRVIADYRHIRADGFEDLRPAGYYYHPDKDKFTIRDTAADFIYTGKNPANIHLPSGLNQIVDADIWLKDGQKYRYFPLFTKKEYLKTDNRHNQLNFLLTYLSDLDEELINALRHDTTTVILAASCNTHKMAEIRRIFVKLIEHDLYHPVFISGDYADAGNEELMLYASTDMGGLLADGLGEGVMLFSKSIRDKNKDKFLNNIKLYNGILFGILQAARTRITRTEYISCPSCGRTLFDLQETTALIRERTDHLKGVKIGIMGCIVNGPGEMADADYGYVGSGRGKITLYRGREVVKRGVPAGDAVEELINLIKEDGRWLEPAEIT